MMKIAKDNLVKFNMPKPKATKKLKEFIEEIRPLLPNATVEQKQKLLKMLEAANAAQQAAIAINMKKRGKKPKKTVSETVDYLPEK
jgi:type IV secretory pathway TrbF-like protein